MAGEIEITWIEHRRLAACPLQYRRAQVVDDDLLRHTQGVEAVDMRLQELLHGLRQGELDIQLAAVGQHHDEERQSSPGVAHRDAAEFPPVHLRRLAGGEGQGQEGLARLRPNLAHIVLDDADAALEPRLVQALEHLLGAERILFQPTRDAALERIEQAGACIPLPGRIGPVDPAAHGLDVEFERLGQLCWRQLLGGAVANGAPGGVVDHRPPSSTACKRARWLATGVTHGNAST